MAVTVHNPAYGRFNIENMLTRQALSLAHVLVPSFTTEI